MEPNFNDTSTDILQQLYNTLHTKILNNGKQRTFLEDQTRSSLIKKINTIISTEEYISKEDINQILNQTGLSINDQLLTKPNL